MNSFVIFIGCVLLSVQGEVQPDSFLGHERKLHMDLLSNYYKYVRPVSNPNDTLNVNFGLSLLGIESLDEGSKILTSHVWLKYTWTDQQLKWNRDDYGGITNLRINVDEIWTPDIQLYNNADDSIDYAFDALPVIHNNGMVLWIPQLRLKSSCQLDMSKYPFDTQTCSLRFGSWTYDEAMLNLTEFDPTNNLDISTYGENHEFELVSSSHVRTARKYPCCPENYVDIQFDLELKRRTNYATHLYMAPCVVLSLLIPFIFILPPGTTDKMFFGIGLMIGHVLIFGQLEGFIPAAYPRMPVIAVYYVSSIVLMALALVVSVFTVNVWHRSNSNKPVPAILRMIFLGVLGRLVCVRREDHMPLEQDEPQPRAHRMEAHSEISDIDVGPDDREKIMRNYSRMTTIAEWRQLAVVLDRVCFVVFSVVIIFIAIIIGH